MEVLVFSALTTGTGRSELSQKAREHLYGASSTEPCPGPAIGFSRPSSINK